MTTPEEETAQTPVAVEDETQVAPPVEEPTPVTAEAPPEPRKRATGRRRKPTTVDLDPEVKPHARHPQVHLLQQLLGVEPTTGQYGPLTRKAVAAFHKTNPDLGVSGHAITPEGFTLLQTRTKPRR